MNNLSYTISSNDDPSLPSSPLCGKIMSNIWEDESIVELDDLLSSLDDFSLCGDSNQNYVVEFTFDAGKYYERGRDKSPICRGYGHDTGATGCSTSSMRGKGSAAIYRTRCTRHGFYQGSAPRVE
jgi:hypothetical protein